MTSFDSIGQAVVYLNISIWIFSNFVLVPIEGYYAYKLFSFKDSLIIAKRKPGMLMVSIVSGMIFYALFQTLSLAFATLQLSVYYEAVGRILYLIIVPFWYIGWCTQISRLWLLFHVIQHNVAMTNNKWQEVIDPKHAETNWYITSKTHWGTWKGLKMKVYAYMLITYIVDIIFSALWQTFHDHDEDDSVQYFATIFTVGVARVLLATIFPLILLIYIFFKIPNFHDNIGLGEELKYCLCGYCLLLLLHFIETVSIAAVRDVNHSWVDIAITLRFFLWKCVVVIINLKQTRWPLKRFAKILKRYSTRHAGILTHAKTLKNVDSNQSPKKDNVKMQNVLKNTKGFDLFMIHCSSEHCAECVLSMIEFLQFKEEIYSELVKNGISDKVELWCDGNGILEDTFVLPDNCPKSHIIQEYNNDFKKISFKLFNKYISVGSKWEVNISYQLRRKYNRLFQNEINWKNNKPYDDLTTLYELFDKCLYEMTNLVKSAFARYITSNTFLVMQNKSKSLRKSMDMANETNSKKFSNIAYEVDSGDDLLSPPS